MHTVTDYLSKPSLKSLQVKSSQIEFTDDVPKALPSNLKIRNKNTRSPKNQLSRLCKNVFYFEYYHFKKRRVEQIGKKLNKEKQNVQGHET